MRTDGRLTRHRPVDLRSLVSCPLPRLLRMLVIAFPECFDIDRRIVRGFAFTPMLQSRMKCMALRTTRRTLGVRARASRITAANFDRRAGNGSKNRYVPMEAGALCETRNSGLASIVSGVGRSKIRPAIATASAVCGDVGFRKKPLRSVSQSRDEVAAVRIAFRALGGETFRDNRGDIAGLVNRDVVYS